MQLRDTIFIAGVVAAIVLASTVIALTLQRHFDRTTALVAVGPALAWLAAWLFAHWLRRTR
jgi:uncharacterized membrane protein